MTTKRIWSDQQKAIFDDVNEGDGHTVIIARAGTGKTTTIVQALNYVPPGLSVLFCAFNKSIATELSARAPKGVDVATLHSFGYRAIRAKFGTVKVDTERAKNLVRAVRDSRGMVAPDSFSRVIGACKLVSLAKGFVHSSREQLDTLIDQYQIDVGPSPTLSTYDAAREECLDVAVEVLRRCEDPTANAAPVDPTDKYSLYKFIVDAASSVDFDDMVWLPVVLKLRTTKFDRVFIDETQDLNPAQVELALSAVKKTGRICAVGDDRQAIYGFRGADSEAVNNIVTRLGAKTLSLTTTYRCARSIVDLARTIVPDYESAPNAPEGVVETIGLDKLLPSIAVGDFLLSRTNAPLIGFCLALIRDDRPATIAGRDIGDRLVGLVKKSKTSATKDLLVWTESWRMVEEARLVAKNLSTQTTKDTADTVTALCEGLEKSSAVIDRIGRIFADGDLTKRIVLSSTHKAKGLERDRVFMLTWTYGKYPGIEEDNLKYVCITRAKSHLFLVEPA